MNTHLTPDQIDDQLLGDLAPAAAAHLAECAFCQAAVAEAEAPMASFRQVSLAWAERRSATMPVPAPSADRRPASRHLAWGALGAAAAAVAIATIVPHAYAPDKPVASAGGTQQSLPSTVSDPTQIASDNQMLAAIDDALNAPVRPVGLTNRSHSNRNTLRD